MNIHTIFLRCKHLFRVICISFKIRRKGSVSLLWALRHLHLYSEDFRIDIRTKKLGDVHIYMYGNGHELIIEDDVKIKKGTIWFENNNCRISIGKKTTIEGAHLAAAEDNMVLTIDDDCMLSQGIYIATTDSHSIISLDSKKRLNKAANVFIGKHVWIGRNVTINKGVFVGDNSVIAGGSIVTKEVPQNVVVAGVPAKVVKTEITWERKRL